MEEEREYQDTGDDELRHLRAALHATEQRYVQLEQRLAEREHFITQLLTVVPGVYIYDCVSEHDVYVSAAFWQSLGYTPEQVAALGENPTFAILHPDEQVPVRAGIAMHHTLRDGEVSTTDFRMLHADHSYRWITSCEVVFARDAAGHPRQMLGIIHDFSAYKQTQDALRTLTSQQQAMLDTIPDLVWLTDTAGRSVAINAAYARFHGRQAAAFTGLTTQEVLPTDLGPSFYQEALTVMNTGQSRRYEHLLTDHAGQEHWFDIIKSAVRSPQGHVLGAIGLARSINARKQAEQAQVQMEHRMQETQRLESLGVLAGGIAHSFNNLLTSIIGHAELALMELAPDADASSSVSAVLVSARRAADLTSQILAFAGKGRFIVEPIALNNVISTIAELMNLVVNHRATLKLNLAADLPPLKADVAQMRQVILNVLTNAVEALGDTHGSITLATAVDVLTSDTLAQMLLGAERPAGTYVRLTIADTGVGIDAATQARIFDPFFSTKFIGRGLGLAAVQGIVRGHHGALKVESAPGRGTTLNVYFPASTITPRHTL